MDAEPALGRRVPWACVRGQVPAWAGRAPRRRTDVGEEMTAAALLAWSTAVRDLRTAALRSMIGDADAPPRMLAKLERWCDGRWLVSCSRRTGMGDSPTPPAVFRDETRARLLPRLYSSVVGREALDMARMRTEAVRVSLVLDSGWGDAGLDLKPKLRPRRERRDNGVDD
ncbi:hypothetical protein A0H81_14476 [Grifola frondosa]|uniref:Uncharacterized protein n=1 Tax=Grifola frondosa TaxID=5627 RepID=A0A1C7LLC4_GRIFR|nr:hypothetical protein A0H81_14476 [Grifola frondosa]